MVRRRLAAYALGCLLAAGLSLTASDARSAGNYPERPLRIVVPYSPGGLPDLTARIVGDGLGARLRQPVVIDNRPGANGIIGEQVVAQAAPDGYTLGFVASSHVFAKSLMPNLPFDPIKDFAPISLLVKTPVVLVSSSTMPFSTMSEFVSYTKTHNANLSYASAGNGSNVHVFGQWMNDALKLNMVHAPYKGSAAAHVDLIAGRVAVAFDTLPAVRPFVNSGKLRILAVGSSRRIAPYPGIPTVAESGVAGFGADSWVAALAPAKTPDPIIDLLNREIQALLRSPNVGNKFAEAGAEVVGSSPQQLQDLFVTQQKQYGALIQRLRITLQ